MQSLSAFTSAVDIQLRSALRDQLSVPLDSIRLSNLRLASRVRLLSVLGGMDVDVTVVLGADAVQTARAATVTLSELSSGSQGALGALAGRLGWNAADLAFSPPEVTDLNGVVHRSAAF